MCIFDGYKYIWMVKMMLLAIFQLSMKSKRRNERRKTLTCNDWTSFTQGIQLGGRHDGFGVDRGSTSHVCTSIYTRIYKYIKGLWFYIHMSIWEYNIVEVVRALWTQKEKKKILFIKFLYFFFFFHTKHEWICVSKCLYIHLINTSDRYCVYNQNQWLYKKNKFFFFSVD